MPRIAPETQPSVSTSLGWMPAIGVAVAALYPAVHGAYWAMPLTGLAAWVGIGVWRVVIMLGMLLNHVYWRDLEVPASDDLT